MAPAIFFGWEDGDGGKCAGGSDFTLGLSMAAVGFWRQPWRAERSKTGGTCTDQGDEGAKRERAHSSSVKREGNATSGVSEGDSINTSVRTRCAFISQTTAGGYVVFTSPALYELFRAPVCLGLVQVIASQCEEE